MLKSTGYLYLATPYTSAPCGLEYAAANAGAALRAFIEAGIPAFCPIVHAHRISKTLPQVKHQDWIDLELPLLLRSLGLVVIEFEGWEDSKGIALERMAAQENGLPVHQVSKKQVFDPNWMRSFGLYAQHGRDICTPDTKTRKFETGAVRDTDENKLDFEGFLSPSVLEAFASYMAFNQVMRDGSLRSSDNWQKGIPPAAYMKSGWRHLVDWWKAHRSGGDNGLVFSICALIFNAQGYLHEYLKEHPNALEDAIREASADRRAARKE